MPSKEYIEAKLKTLKSELRHWHNISRSNPWQYVGEYIGVLERRIKAYEKILPYARELRYGISKREESRVGHWNM